MLPNIIKESEKVVQNFKNLMISPLAQNFMKTKSKNHIYKKQIKINKKIMKF